MSEIDTESFRGLGSHAHRAQEQDEREHARQVALGRAPASEASLYDLPRWHTSTLDASPVRVIGTHRSCLSGWEQQAERGQAAIAAAGGEAVNPNFDPDSRGREVEMTGATTVAKFGPSTPSTG